MRVELHSMAHDVRHLVVATVVHTLHGMEYASLHRLQAILYMWHRTVKDDIRGIVQEPVLVHAAEVMHHRGIKTVDRAVVRLSVCFIVCLLLYYYFVVHHLSFL